MPSESTTECTGFDLEKVVVSLNEAYEIVTGASVILRLLYERLQGSFGRESVETASIMFTLRRSLAQSADMIGTADVMLEVLRDEMPLRAAEGDER